MYADQSPTLPPHEVLLPNSKLSTTYSFWLSSPGHSFIDWGITVELQVPHTSRREVAPDSNPFILHDKDKTAYMIYGIKVLKPIVPTYALVLDTRNV